MSSGHLKGCQKCHMWCYGRKWFISLVSVGMVSSHLDILLCQFETVALWFSELYHLLTRAGHRSVRSMYLNCWVSNHKSQFTLHRQTPKITRLQYATSQSFQDLTNMFNQQKQALTNSDKTCCHWTASVGAVWIGLNLNLCYKMTFEMMYLMILPYQVWAFFFCLFLSTVKMKVASGRLMFHHHYWNITHKKNFRAITADWSEKRGCSTSLFHLTPYSPFNQHLVRPLQEGTKKSHKQSLNQCSEILYMN